MFDRCSYTRRASVCAAEADSETAQMAKREVWSQIQQEKKKRCAFCALEIQLHAQNHQITVFNRCPATAEWKFEHLALHLNSLSRALCLSLSSPKLARPQHICGIHIGKYCPPLFTSASFFTDLAMPMCYWRLSHFAAAAATYQTPNYSQVKSQVATMSIFIAYVSNSECRKYYM